jgi:hypothetical protein
MNGTFHGKITRAVRASRNNRTAEKKASRYPYTYVTYSAFTKQGEAPFAKSVDLLHFLLARGPGPGTYAN